MSNSNIDQIVDFVGLDCMMTRCHSKHADTEYFYCRFVLAVLLSFFCLFEQFAADSTRHAHAYCRPTGYDFY